METLTSEGGQPMNQKANRKDTDLVLLSEVHPSIAIDLALATKSNPFGIQAYRCQCAYLRYGTAKKLAKIQEDLRKQELGLKIWAAYRPFVVQVEMFRAVGENGDFVSDPYRPSGKKTHVRGVAVDCTLIDKAGVELPMPTGYLDFEKGVEKMKHSFMDLPENVLRNRKLLKEAMAAGGMESYKNEWWHYQDKEWAKYPIVRFEDFPEVHKNLLVEELFARARAQ